MQCIKRMLYNTAAGFFSQRYTQIFATSPHFDNNRIDLPNIYLDYTPMTHNRSIAHFNILYKKTTQAAAGQSILRQIILWQMLF
jgi:hypothetical protein